jgi:two-component system alkaline phosphatase synthesis response regulator PhoP
MTARQIMIVSSETTDKWMVDALRDHGFEVAVATTPVASERVRSSPPDLLVIDVLDPREGIELLKSVRSGAELKTTLVMVIAEWGTGQPTLALSNGADAFEPKPINAPRLIAAVEKLLRPNMVMVAQANALELNED